MKVALVCLVLVAVAVAAPADKDAIITHQEFDNLGVNQYAWSFKTNNDISQQEQGQLKNEGTDTEALSVRGTYAYTGADGIPYKVDYLADENGFQPKGDHLPAA